MTNQFNSPNPGIPVSPPDMPAYAGPNVGTGANDLQYTYGLGKPTSGMCTVDAEANGRSFGIRGQGYLEGDASLAMNSALYGSKLPEEDTDAPTKTYSTIVV